MFVPGDKWLLGLDCSHPRDVNSAEGVGESRKQNMKLFKEHFKDFCSGNPESTVVRKGSICLEDNRNYTTILGK